MTKEPEIKETIYASRDAPSLTFDKQKFMNGTFKSTDEVLIARWDELIATKPAVSQLIYKIDREAALKVAEAYKAKMLQAGVKGSMSSSDLKAMEAKTGSQELAKVQANPLTEPVIPKKDLLVTEEGKAEHHDDGGFIPDVVAEAPIDNSTDAKATLNILGKKDK